MRAPRPRENEQKSCDDEKADKKRNDAGIDRIEGLPGDVLHEDPVDGKPREPVARLRDAQEVTEHRRAGKDDEYHHRRSKRLENSCINC